MSFGNLYHDDPVDNRRNRGSSKGISGLLALVLTIFGAGFYLQSTLAANVSLNSGGAIEFGQGTARTVACSEGQSLIITPQSTFVNVSGAGSHKFSSIKVTNIPTACRGQDFTFSAYNNVASSAAQAIFNTSSTRAVVYMKEDDTFEVGIGGTGLSVTTNSASSFTVTFTAPVVASSSVFNLTVESAAHSPVPCSEGGDCIIGERGPGNGIVFYISAAPFTSSKSTCNTNCRYLEVAPAGWANGGVVTDDPDLKFSSDQSNATGMTLSPSAISQSGRSGELENWKIGMGSLNTFYIMTPNGSHTADTQYAAYTAWNYAGTDNSAGQWFIPSVNEINELCKYAWGQPTGDPAVACTSSGTFKSTASAGSDLGGFRNNQYITSSEVSSGTVTIFNFALSVAFTQSKIYGEYNRAIRAF